MKTLVQYLLPWDFSPTVLLICLLSAVAYVRGLAVLRQRRMAQPATWQSIAFFVGLALDYAALQTYFDYLSQHMFWVHRLQHLVLHHIAPILLVASAPFQTIRCGLPQWLQERVLEPLPRQTAVRGALRLIQSPAMALLLFVGLIYYWLIPSVHFAAMLDVHRYLLMNWSMAVDGILFWWLMIARRDRQGTFAVGYGIRILILCLAALLQILLGAYITLHRTVLFDVYAICGRAWNLSPLVDQQLGGLATWIPAAMMSGVGVLVVLYHLMHDSETRQQRSLVPAIGESRSL
ncbi:MAG TPA: cytochrome c oxidase assembly protein [Steroidobacteraceae bacterium]|nr:cytochrome c oxidase assembly protein [Steroidobacteraceae bacterium]